MLILLLVLLIGAAAVEVAIAPAGRHRGVRRVVPVVSEGAADARHRR
ncbi:hypothetical protein ACFWA9_00140 [Kitasatospora sp. NPDC059973]